jgi:hypothetical protein
MGFIRDTQEVGKEYGHQFLRRHTGIYIYIHECWDFILPSKVKLEYQPINTIMSPKRVIAPA